MKYVKEILLLLVGVMLMAASTAFFLLPNQLSSGGFTGVATIFYYLLEFPVGTVILALNIPLLIFSYFKLGKWFLIKAFVGILFLSIFINIFTKFEGLTDDRLLACIYGGIITGIGQALVLKTKASTGGTDLLTNIIKSFKPNLKTGTMIVIIDFVIILLNVLFFKEIEIGLYSAIIIYIIGKILDIFFEGINFSKMIYIITDKPNEISRQLNDLGRGVTGLYGKGMYSGKEKTVLTCVAARGEVQEIKDVAHLEDNDCFIIITDAREVFGEGFKEKAVN